MTCYQKDVQYIPNVRGSVSKVVLFSETGYESLTHRSKMFQLVCWNNFFTVFLQKLMKTLPHSSLKPVQVLKYNRLPFKKIEHEVITQILTYLTVHTLPCHHSQVNCTYVYSRFHLDSSPPHQQFIEPTSFPHQITPSNHRAASQHHSSIPHWAHQPCQQSPFFLISKLHNTWRLKLLPDPLALLHIIDEHKLQAYVLAVGILGCQSINTEALGIDWPWGSKYIFKIILSVTFLKAIFPTLVL